MTCRPTTIVNNIDVVQHKYVNRRTDWLSPYYNMAGLVTDAVARHVGTIRDGVVTVTLSAAGRRHLAVASKTGEECHVNKTNAVWHVIAPIEHGRRILLRLEITTNIRLLLV